MMFYLYIYEAYVLSPLAESFNPKAFVLSHPNIKRINPVDVAATGLIRTLLTYPATVLVPPLAVWICVVLYMSCCVGSWFCGELFE